MGGGLELFSGAVDNRHFNNRQTAGRNMLPKNVRGPSSVLILK